MKPLLLLALSALTALMLPSAYAEYKVATVDINRLLNESKEAKSKKKELDEVSLKAKAKLEAQRKTLKATEDKLKAAGVSADSKEAEKFRQDARDFTHSVKDTDEDLKKQFYQINKQLTDRALEIVRKFAEKNKLDLVLDKSEKGRGPVLFGDASADITNDILREINQ